MVHLYIVIVAVLQYLHRVNGKHSNLWSAKIHDSILYSIIHYTKDYLLISLCLSDVPNLHIPSLPRKHNKKLLYIYVAINVTVTTISSVLQPVTI